MKTINVALASFGMSGKVFHAPFFNNSNYFKLYAVWERTKNEAVVKYPNIKSYNSFNALLADSNIDLVVINTPSVTHFEYAKLALEADKHILVEKPFTATTAQAKELIKLATIKEKQIAVFQNRRWDSDFLTVKKIIESNQLGNLKEVSIHFDRYQPEPSPKQHKEANTPAVGLVYDLGAHLIDSALHLFGMPEAVFADIMKMRPNTLVDDYFEIILYYPTWRVRLHASLFAKQGLGFVVHGSLGSFVKPRADVQETQLQSGMLPTDIAYGVEPTSAQGTLFLHNNELQKIESLKGDYSPFFEELAKSILYNTATPVTANDGYNVIAIIEAAYLSNSNKKVVNL
jgi:scyllo-inositol 2-dehydrogenase (NADP+)